MTQKVDLEVMRGDTKKYDVTITNGTTGQAYDISDDTVTFTVKENKSDAIGSAKINHVNGSGEDEEHSDPTNGKTQINLSITETNLTPKTYYYDIQWDRSNGERRTLQYGKFEVLTDITTVS